MPSKILIISHVFPPIPGIGGRRWAKFSKYLKRKGFDVSVISTENIYDNESAWNDDIKELKILRLPYAFPKIVSHPKPGLLNKISYFLNLFLLKRSDKGNYFDKTIYWKNQIRKNISYQITTNGVNVVIVTAAPFRLSNYVVTLKKQYPEVKFVVDFRDYWTKDSEISSFAGLSDERKEFERDLEEQTVTMADEVLCVADNMKSYFAELCSPEKIHVIPNGFDTDDFKLLDKTQSVKSDKIKFLFSGTLYINLEYVMQPFFEALGKIKKQNNDLYSKLEVKFVGSFPQQYHHLIEQNKVSDCVRIEKTKPLADVYTDIFNSDYCLLFLNDVYNFALSTKFCEYISQQKNIVIVSNKGETSEFITKNKIGYWINPLSAYDDLINLLNNTINGTAKNWNTEFDSNQFSIDKLTDKLISTLSLTK